MTYRDRLLALITPNTEGVTPLDILKANAAKGDVVGHEFHGNQYTAAMAGHMDNAAEHLKNASEAAARGDHEAAGQHMASAQSSLRSAEGVRQAARDAERQAANVRAREERAPRRGENPDGTKFHSGYDGRGMAVLPTGERTNPTTKSGMYGEPNQTHLVVKVGETASGKDQLRVVSSYGGTGDTYRVGDRMLLAHDQTGQRLSSWGGGKIIGIHHDNGDIEGDVPDKNIPHYVFK